MRLMPFAVRVAYYRLRNLLSRTRHRLWPANSECPACGYRARRTGKRIYCPACWEDDANELVPDCPTRGREQHPGNEVDGPGWWCPRCARRDVAS